MPSSQGPFFCGTISVNALRSVDEVFLEEIHTDLCRFLLAVPLRHGARSLERIVEACLVSRPSKLSLMHLPPDHFLEEHIENEDVRVPASHKIGMTIDEMKRLAATTSGNAVATHAAIKPAGVPRPSRRTGSRPETPRRQALKPRGRRRVRQKPLVGR